MAIISFSDEAAWHQLRAQNVGASEVAALFGLSPWTTKWKLYMQKSGQLPPVDEKAWMSRGRHFEPAIASYAREEFELDIVKVDHYWTDDSCPGLGASLDYTLADDHGMPIEIKWVERHDGWDWTGDEITLAPDYYVMQVQHQMACTGASRGMLLPFVGGTVRRMIVPRSEAIIGAIRTSVKSFWDDVTTRREPPVDFLQDADTISLLARHRPLRSTELGAHMAGVFAMYLDQKAVMAAAEKNVEASKAQLLKAVMDIPGVVGNDSKAIVTCGEYRMSLSKIEDNPGKIIGPEMIGQVFGARKGNIRTTISKKG